MTPASFTIPGSAAIWLAIGWTVAGLGLLLLLWALFKDRARGRLRCPKCWYDMSGARSANDGEALDLRCPECGHDARKRKRLGKTRRKWRVAFLALLVIVLGGAAMSVPTVRFYGPWPLLPEWIVRASAPNGIWTGYPRVDSPEAELLRRAKARSLSNHGWACVLDALDQPNFTTPKRWVAGEHLPYHLSWIQLFRDADFLCRVRLQDDESSASPLVAPDAGSGIRELVECYGADAIVLPGTVATGWIDADPRSDPPARIRVEVVRRDDPERRICSREFPIKTEFRASEAELLDPLDWEPLESTVQLRGRFRIPRGNAPMNLCEDVELWRSIPGTSGGTMGLPSLLGSTVWSLQIECEGFGADTSPARGVWSAEPIGIRHLGPVPFHVERYSGSPFVYTVKLTPDRNIRIRDWHATHYWSGEIEVQGFGNGNVIDADTEFVKNLLNSSNPSP